MIKHFNNKTQKVGDDLKEIIGKGSKISMAAAIFSIYGFESLKKELKDIEELRFIFTDPTFIEMDKKNRQEKMFEILANDRKKSIGGSRFEINLKNELKGKAIAKECRKWIEDKVTFKTNAKNGFIQPQFIIKNPDNNFAYSGINEFSSAGVGYEKDNSILNMVTRFEDFPITDAFLQQFDDVWNDKNILKDVTKDVSSYIDNLYKENAPELIYYIALFHIFDEFLENITEDELANEQTGFKESVVWNTLYDFQKDAVLGIINKLERYNGCILADSVGLGKTFSALGVIKYYQERNKSVLVLCPKKLGDNWKTFLSNYDDNILFKDRFNYDVLYHTDLSREKGKSGDTDLSRVNWGNYDLVVIDESHNFRNNDPRKDKITRYKRLLQNVMQAGVKTKVLMLSATPVNNKFTDLKNQIALAYEGKTNVVDEKLGTEKSIDSILNKAQRTFKDWSDLPVEQRTSKKLLAELNQNFDFFKLLDNITISRSRKHITKYYDTNAIGKFPKRLPPVTIESEITHLKDFMKIKELYEKLAMLSMSIYTPFDYILDSKIAFYADVYDTKIEGKSSLKQTTREKSLQKLMRVNLLKRLESSVDSFRITLDKFVNAVNSNIKNIEKFEKTGGNQSAEMTQIEDINFDTEIDNWLDDEFSTNGKVKINLADMNTSGWKEDLKQDLYIAQDILEEMNWVTPKEDAKLNDLKKCITNKIENPINKGNKKIIIFTAFADTANYLYKQIATWALENHQLNTAKITGSGANDCTLKIDKQFNNLLINFSPRSKKRKEIHKNNTEIDILIATDCISEGQNLQDCDTLINYDIHWNPVRIIQRFGRVDRIGSINTDIQLINFWPQISLDDYINLKGRVEGRMIIADVAGTTEDNPLTNKSTDLDFRKQQLERLKDEVVDIEDMDTGISITDLGLNDFRMDLINYINEGNDLKGIPNGMHAVCPKITEKGIDEGVIFVLKNINSDVNIDNNNQLHPFYLVYIKQNGNIISNHLNVKNTLDILRGIAKGNSEPITKMFQQFNTETKDGKNMKTYSNLLEKSIESIIEVKDESVIDSLFSKGGTTANLSGNIKGLEDFDLITFLVIK
ncbi:helicase-related protein [Tenacibaculum finnmarkense]|uniref:helicase-related protein n=1 Tax=Tenacibaculum finnmarkense TaxID=2781243 RepID=UPI000C3DB498|nr:helicase-related protein [Tenacibaculum finnmarkense]MCD8439953.1 SNF2-related protein [Tenacibaculum finnmarkense genomovar ulcerans]MCG8720855.1 DEAD/DEAH box helicase family protein [Tenacibaculum finnmarkense]SOS54455.1 Helicase domain protein [Tenacibaculum finnmarkense]